MVQTLKEKPQKGACIDLASPSYNMQIHTRACLQAEKTRAHKLVIHQLYMLRAGGLGHAQAYESCRWQQADRDSSSLDHLGRSTVF